MATHTLKCWPEFFADIDSGKKKFELRKNDRNYQVDDMLVLREWNPETQFYSGREVVKRITYILEHRAGAGCAADFGLKDGYAILSLQP